jgi:hypothetical protein
MIVAAATWAYCKLSSPARRQPTSPHGSLLQPINAQGACGDGAGFVRATPAVADGTISSATRTTLQELAARNQQGHLPPSTPTRMIEVTASALTSAEPQSASGMGGVPSAITLYPTPAPVQTGSAPVQASSGGGQRGGTARGERARAARKAAEQARHPTTFATLAALASRNARGGASSSTSSCKEPPSSSAYVPPDEPTPGPPPSIL